MMYRSMKILEWIHSAFCSSAWGLPEKRMVGMSVRVMLSGIPVLSDSLSLVNILDVA